MSAAAKANAVQNIKSIDAELDALYDRAPHRTRLDPRWSAMYSYWLEQSQGARAQLQEIEAAEALMKMRGVAVQCKQDLEDTH